MPDMHIKKRLTSFLLGKYKSKSQDFTLYSIIKRHIIISVGDEAKKLEPSYLLVGMQNGWSQFEKQFAIL